jgi:hypothetical protein
MKMKTLIAITLIAAGSALAGEKGLLQEAIDAEKMAIADEHLRQISKPYTGGGFSPDWEMQQLKWRVETLEAKAITETAIIQPR